MSSRTLDGECIVRQQEQPDNTRETDLSFSAKAETTFPATRSSPNSQVRKDVDRGELRQGQMASDLVALSRLLIGSQPVEQRLATALVVARRLLPQEWILHLFECLDSGTTLCEITPSRGYQVSERQDLRHTLGFGEAIDHQVLRERAPVRTEQLLCMPLINATGVIVGVLVVLRASKTPDSNAEAVDAVLEVIGAHITMLLAWAAEDRLSHSSVATLQSLPGLALPTITQPIARESRARRDAAALDALYEAQDRLLTSAVEALNRVIATAGYAETVIALALTRTISGEWKLLRAGLPAEGAAQIPSGGFMSLIAQLATQRPRDTVVPLNVGPANNPAIWEALLPLCECIAEYTGIEVADLTLLPIIDTRQQVTAWLCMAWRAAVDVNMEQLFVLATSIAVAATAGARNLQLAEAAQAEGRARDAFISLMAHELRSPLTSIKGYAQLLMRQSKKHAIPDAMLRSVESIEQQSGRMAEMVGELLDASRITRGVLEVQVAPVDLVPLAHKVVERRAAQFPQHTITFDTIEDSVVVLADVQRVEQVLRDLVDNGAHHMPKGGTVTVALSRQGSMALFTVRDQGIGIPERERERIFEYLYRSSLSEQKNLSGLGLGLYVSRHLVERFGGKLWLEGSRVVEPTGSEFRFTLPLAKPSMENAHQRA